VAIRDLRKAGFGMGVERGVRRFKYICPHIDSNRHFSHGCRAMTSSTKLDLERWFKDTDVNRDTK
jgi:hypothetical protein